MNTEGSSPLISTTESTRTSFSLVLHSPLLLLCIHNIYSGSKVIFLDFFSSIFVGESSNFTGEQIIEHPVF
ncbi:hypothetical protein GQ457_18G024290 [Hibiscus cannabinus]